MHGAGLHKGATSLFLLGPAALLFPGWPMAVLEIDISINSMEPINNFYWTKTHAGRIVQYGQACRKICSVARPSSEDILT